MTVTIAYSITITTVPHFLTNDQVMFKARTRISRTRESAWEKEQAKALRDIRKERKSYRQQNKEPSWLTKTVQALCFCMKADTNTDKDTETKQVLVIKPQLGIARPYSQIEFSVIHRCFYLVQCFYVFNQIISLPICDLSG